MISHVFLNLFAALLRFVQEFQMQFLRKLMKSLFAQVAQTKAVNIIVTNVSQDNISLYVY